MADKTIGDLPVAGALYEDSLLVVEQQSEARSIKGKLVADFARESAAADVQRAVDAADKAEKAAAGAAAEVSQRLAGYVDDAKGSADAAKQAKAGAAESLARLDGQVEQAEAARTGAEEARDAIEGMTVSADTLPPGSAATAVKTTADGSFNIHLGIPAGERGDMGPEGPVGPEGPQGPRGATGRGFTILGRYESREALAAAVQEPSVGDAYQVGAGAPYDVYIYDDVNGWVNSGPINVDLPAHLIVGEDSELGAALPVDADTLEGHPAEDFVSDTELAAGLEKKQDVLPYYTNKNLLDNWYFVGGGSQKENGSFPINQRGETSYAGLKYGIDRWKEDRAVGTITLKPEGLEIEVQSNDESNSFFIQVSPLDAILKTDETITISAIIDGELYSVSGKASDPIISVDFGNGVFYRAPIDNNDIICITSYKGTKILVQAVKMEFGSQQTLAHQENGVWVLNEIPDYATELAKCQRYQEDTGFFLLPLNTKNNFDMTIKWAVEKRSTPTATVYSQNNIAGKASVWVSTTDSSSWVDADMMIETKSDLNGPRVWLRNPVDNGTMIAFKIFGDANI